MSLFTGLQILCTFTIVAPLIHHLSPNALKTSYTITASIFYVPYWPPSSTDNLISFVVPSPSQWFFHYGEEIVNAWTDIGWLRWMLQNLQLPASQEVYDCSSGVAPCKVMKNGGILYYLVKSFSPGRWTNVVLQECAVEGSVYHLRAAVLPSSVSYAIMSFTFTAQCVERTFFGWGEPGCFHSFVWSFKFDSYDRANVSL